MNKLEWALHFKEGHSTLPGGPSVEEMCAYPLAFAKVAEDHRQLHLRFETGHEHSPIDGRPMKPPNKKPKVTVEVVDD